MGMKITSAKFVKGVVGSDEFLEGSMPQVAFIGRSNVGKSSIINSLVNQKDLAKTSSSPGSTKEINLFFINKSFYLVDLPGYGFSKASWEEREQLLKLIYWYLLNPHYKQKVIALIVDAKVGPTADDLAMLKRLEGQRKEIVIVANKIDKLKRSAYKKQLKMIQNMVGAHKVILYSSRNKIGITELTEEVLK